MSTLPIRPNPTADGFDPPSQNTTRSPLVQAARLSVTTTSQKSPNPSSQHPLITSTAQSATPPPTPPTAILIAPDTKPLFVTKKPSSNEVIDLTTPSPGAQSPDSANSPPEESKNVNNAPLQSTEAANQNQKDEDVVMGGGLDAREEVTVTVASETQGRKVTDEETEEGEIQNLLNQPDPSPSDNQIETRKSTEEDMDVDSNEVENPTVTTTTATLSTSQPPSSIIKENNHTDNPPTFPPIPPSDQSEKAAPSSSSAPETPHVPTQASAPANAQSPTIPGRTIFSPGATLQDGWKRILAFGKTGAITSSAALPGGMAGDDNPSSAPEAAASTSSAVAITSQAVPRQLSLSPEPEVIAPAIPTSMGQRPGDGNKFHESTGIVRTEDPLLTSILNDPALHREVLPAMRALWSVLDPQEREEIRRDRAMLNSLLVKHFGAVVAAMGRAMVNPTLPASELSLPGASPSTGGARDDYERFVKWSSVNMPNIWQGTGVPIVNSLFNQYSAQAIPIAPTRQPSTHSLAQGLVKPSPSDATASPQARNNLHTNVPNSYPVAKSAATTLVRPHPAPSMGYFPAQAANVNAFRQAAELSKQQSSVIDSRRGGSLSGPLPATRPTNAQTAGQLRRPTSQPSTLTKQFHHTQLYPQSRLPLPRTAHVRPLPQAGSPRMQASEPQYPPQAHYSAPATPTDQPAPAPMPQESPSAYTAHHEPHSRLPVQPAPPQPSSSLTAKPVSSMPDRSKGSLPLTVQSSSTLHEAELRWIANQDYLAKLMQQVWYASTILTQEDSLISRDTSLAAKQQYAANAVAKITSLENALAQAQQDKVSEVTRGRQDATQRETTSRESHATSIEQMRQKHEREINQLQSTMALKHNETTRLEAENNELKGRLRAQNEDTRKLAEFEEVAASARKEAAQALDEVKRQAGVHRLAVEALKMRHDTETASLREHAGKSTLQMAEVQKEKEEYVSKLKDEHHAALRELSSKDEARIRNLDRANSALREELKKAQMTASTATDTTQVAEDLRSVIAQQAIEIKRSDERRTKSEEEKSDFEEQVTKLRADVEELNAKLEEERQRIGDIEVEQAKIIEEETKAAEARVTAAQGQLKHSLLETAALRASVAAMKMDYQARFQAAAGKRKEAEERAETLQVKMKQSEDERARSAKEEAAKVDRADEMRRRHDEEMGILKARVDELEVEVETQRKEAERVTQLEAEIEELLKQQRELGEEQAEMDKQRKRLEEEKEDLDDKLDTANMERLAQLDKVDELQKEITILKRTLQIAQTQKKEAKGELTRGRSPEKFKTVLAAKDSTPKIGDRDTSPARGRASSPSKASARESSPAKRAASPNKGKAAPPIGAKPRAASPSKFRASSPANGRPASPSKDRPSATTSSSGAKALGPSQADALKRKRLTEPLFTSVDETSPAKAKKSRSNPEQTTSDNRSATPVTAQSILPPVDRLWVTEHLGLFMFEGQAGKRKGVRCRGCHVDKKNDAKEAFRNGNPAATLGAQDAHALRVVGAFNDQPLMEGIDSIEEDMDGLLDHLLDDHENLMRRLRKKRIAEGKE